ncbi:hypothetical protein OsI_35784 [Oryza sativa Indica Group]|uniref:Uncharacterized protein n=1 Tax=Oryza sativa subsp. indica TaxID=39946 RepID=B8BK14_ORYSI|nr:hypothetical protein OsI_35784 [Oryza sativa Indica Group]
MGTEVLFKCSMIEESTLKVMEMLEQLDIEYADCANEGMDLALCGHVVAQSLCSDFRTDEKINVPMEIVSKGKHKKIGNTISKAAPQSGLNHWHKAKTPEWKGYQANMLLVQPTEAPSTTNWLIGGVMDAYIQIIKDMQCDTPRGNGIAFLLTEANCQIWKTNGANKGARRDIARTELNLQTSIGSMKW